MSHPISLSHFLTDKDTQIRIFDMGRRVSKISLKDFQKFEQGSLPYPYPYQQTAWVGLLFWNIKNKEQHNIWFVRMPLDERGFINVASRDEFLDMLLSRIGEQITNKAQSENKLTHALKDNPYVFKPTEENMAIFHSKAKQILGLPASGFLAETLKYLTSNDYQNWQHLGLQGFADVAVRQSEPEVNALLCNAVSYLPEQPFCALCNALENEICSPELMGEISKLIRSYIQQEENTETVNRLVSCVRVLASSAPEKFKITALTEILQSKFSNNPAVLVMIAAKSWEALEDNVLLTLYLEKLALNTNGIPLFNALMNDQMFMPGKRNKILQIFRNPERSEALSTAVGSFFQQMSNTQ
ncbi:MAG: DUF3549 family protein [Gammaproteobacteria bacterium]|nr:DUF3549 family protein [Gammaproteobacteria bacterium]